MHISGLQKLYNICQSTMECTIGTESEQKTSQLLDTDNTLENSRFSTIKIEQIVAEL